MSITENSNVPGKRQRVCIYYRHEIFSKMADWKKIQKKLTHYAESDKLISFSAGLFSRTNDFYFNYGFADVQKQKNSSNGSLYEIGSISKLITASIYSVLFERNELKLTDTVYSLLYNKTEVHPHFKNITLLSLLTHTSGLPRLPGGFVDAIPDISNPYKDYTDDLLTEYLKYYDSFKAPGKYLYSNLGYGLLGYMLKARLQQDLYQIAKEYVFDVLCMNDTCILKNADPADLACGYSNENLKVPNWEMNTMEAAGQFISNTTDMVKFIRANLAKGNTAISPALMNTHTRYTDKTGLGWHRVNMFLRLFGYGSYVWHNGMTGGFSSYISLSVKKQAGFILLTNKPAILTSYAYFLYSYL